MNNDRAEAQDSHFQQLAAEYRASEARCLASLDQLRAAEREYNRLAAALDREEQRYRSEEVAHAIAELHENSRRKGWPEIETLSDREFEVFALIGAGKSSREIGQLLHVAISTVETYRERLKQKLQLKSGNELTRLATIWAVSRKLAGR